MGITQIPGHMSDAVTPICNDCGVTLCYDISVQEYREHAVYWDAWRCDACYPEAPGSYLRYRQSLLTEGSPSGMAPGSEPGLT